jgi:hypothetical protein
MPMSGSIGCAGTSVTPMRQEAAGRSAIKAGGMALLLATCAACGSHADAAQPPPCGAILTLGQSTYWGTQIGNRHILLKDDVGPGVLSSCADGTAPHRGTGGMATTYKLNGYPAGTALVSPGGPGDPFMLWIKTTGDEPPFVLPASLQQVIEDNPVEPDMIGVN